MNSFKIGKKIISDNSPTYFIADIASNHDGSLDKAKELIHKAAENGANAAKFQNFYATTLVSDYGFENLKLNSHQSKWNDSVFNTYKKNEISLKWTDELKKTCNECEIDYLTASYDLNILKYLNKYVAAWKVGSGDITWHEHILKMAKYNKPIFIATGASNIQEVEIIVKKVLKINKKLVLMQCNTNYTATKENFKHINLNVLNLYKKKFPRVLLGLSDHTRGYETVLGAVALGARVIEKHFTNSNKNIGPDHDFSMNPKNWREMVEATRNLENSMGKPIKKVEKNEENTVILQRRSIRVNKNKNARSRIAMKDIVFLRPCPKDAIPPYMMKKYINKKIKVKIIKGEYLKKKHFY
jgi:sialic acid synthase SpsE